MRGAAALEAAPAAALHCKRTRIEKQPRGGCRAEAEAGAGPGGVGQDLVLEELGGDHDRRDQQPLPRNEKSSASRMIVKNLMRLLLLILKRWRFS